MFGFARTVDAKQYRRVKLQALGIDRLVALQAHAVLTVVYALQRGRDSLQHFVASLTRGLRHSLNLHGIHARQTADFGLVELDDRRGSFGRLHSGLKFRTKLQELVAHLICHALPHIGLGYVRAKPLCGFRFNPVKS